jgi:uncharacterized protein
MSKFFVAEKINYKIEGACRQCGKCCRYMYSVYEYNDWEFRLMTKLFPKYRRFKIIGSDEEGRMIFACNLVGDDGRCTVYRDRLKMCKDYPHANVKYGGKLPENCGYNVILKKSFQDYLK